MNKLISLLITASLLTSCSVAMAARKEGTSITQVQSARTRGHLLASGGILVMSERTRQGELIEVYQFKMERGSTARAFMHGCLDVATWGIWEVVGTPVEGELSRDEYYCIRAYFDDKEMIQRLELL